MDGDDKIVSLIPTDDENNNLFVLKNHERFCDHRWEIDQETRTITCLRCGKESTAWDVLIRIAYDEGQDRQILANLRKEIAKLKAWNPFLRAVRELERIWRGKMLPTCPNCGIGVTAEGLVNGTQVNKDLPEIAKKRAYEVKSDG